MAPFAFLMQPFGSSGLMLGDSVYLVEEYVSNNRCLTLSKTPKIPDRMDELTEAWDKPSRR
jgi:hypothetical protein